MNKLQRANVRDTKDILGELYGDRRAVIRTLLSDKVDTLFYYSKEFKDLILDKFQNINEMSIFEAIHTSIVMTIIARPEQSGKIYETLMTQAFGKPAEEVVKNKVELQPIQDPLDIIKSLDKNTLIEIGKMIAEMNQEQKQIEI
jgi:hypothetical protein